MINNFKPAFNKASRGFAFTLAEVLITLAIIGVVAALAIPILYSNYQKEAYVTGLKKMNSVIQNALTSAYVNNNCNIGDNACLEALANNYGSDYLYFHLQKELKTVNVACSQQAYNNPGFCFDYYSIYADNDVVGIDYAMTLTDGSLILRSSKGLVVDVNGTKGPNLLGRDMFIFSDNTPSDNGILLYPMSDDYKSQCTTESVKNANSYGPCYCTQRVMMEGKMNY